MGKYFLCKCKDQSSNLQHLSGSGDSLPSQVSQLVSFRFSKRSCLETTKQNYHTTGGALEENSVSTPSLHMPMNAQAHTYVRTYIQQKYSKKSLTDFYTSTT